jgi:hypothetical protein
VKQLQEVLHGKEDEIFEMDAKCAQLRKEQKFKNREFQRLQEHFDRARTKNLVLENADGRSFS